ncbi:MAG: hypothetical protein IJS44_02960 [Clostridia bacterium]|nr:hypothetical protein [Clostridia bacterium]
MKTLLQKLNSRKFITALVGMVGGILLIANGNTTEGTTALVGSILGYLAAEGLVDLAAVKKTAEKTAENEVERNDDFGYSD